MKVRKNIGNLGKEALEQKVDEFLEELDEGAIALLEHFEGAEDPEHMAVETDSTGKIIGSTNKDGSHYLLNLHSETIDELNEKADDLQEQLDNIPENENFENVDDIEQRLEIKVDSEKKIVSQRKPDGTLVENVGIETNKLTLTEGGMSDFQQALKNAGFNSGNGNWSDYISNDGDNPLHLPIPRLAFINILSDYNLSTLRKKGYSEASKEGVNYNLPTQIEYWDNMGNYFKKWTLMSGQGSSTMAFPKKSIALDFFDSEVGGDAFKIKFGDWVPQDSFHFKAFYNDFFKGISFCAYQIADEVAKTRNVLEDVQWKRALYPKYDFDSNVLANAQIDDMTLQLGTEAKCQPDGFPCIIYQNGEFHGMYVLGIKKNRDNYVQKKGKASNIHIDGEMYAASKHLFAGHIDWSAFEVRNPKNLVYAEKQYDAESGEYTYKYDADILNFGQSEIAGNSDGSTEYDSWVLQPHPVGKIVKYTTSIDGKTHKFLNTVADNTETPAITYNAQKDEWTNDDGNPDFKNKTGCGWLNVTDTIKVKESIIKISHSLATIEAADIITAEADGWAYKGSDNNLYSNSEVTLINDTYYVTSTLVDGQPTPESIEAESLHRHLYIGSDGNRYLSSDLVTTYSGEYHVKDSKIPLIEKYFDIQSLIDYELIQCAVADVDAIWNNCQWLTWDGVKWFACEYDKDDSFGALVSCSGVRDNGGWSLSLWNTEDVDDDSPIGLVRKYYQTEAATRWQELVEKGIFTTEHFIGVITHWMKRFGSDFYKKEYNKWPNAACAKDTNINTTYWKYVACEYQCAVTAYNANTQYAVGDRCSKTAIDPDWKHVFECVSACQGENPTTGTLGYRGNIGQLYEFIKGNFEKENAFFESILNNNNN